MCVYACHLSPCGGSDERRCLCVPNAEGGLRDPPDARATDLLGEHGERGASAVVDGGALAGPLDAAREHAGPLGGDGRGDPDRRPVAERRGLRQRRPAVSARVAPGA